VIIAIDGPAASGKGTLARGLADRFGLPHLDTGKLYRAVALALSDRGFPADDAAAALRAAEALDVSALPEDALLRRADLGEGASVVSAHPAVRSALLAAQRAFAARPGGAVLDGRDIGTVVCPGADLKVFVVADPEVRARRRHADLARGEPGLSFEAVLEEILRRDARDSSRADAPLACAPDAVVVDTTALSPADAVEAALSAFRRP